MVNSLLLDTDACIEIIRGNPEPVEAFPDFALFVSTISQFEILSGLRQQSSPRKEQRARLFLEACDLLAFDEEAAQSAARTRIYLEDQGCRIGAYDLLLAGHAMAIEVPILTGNLQEFSRVPGLTVHSWRNSG